MQDSGLELAPVLARGPVRAREKYLPHHHKRTASQPVRSRPEHTQRVWPRMTRRAWGRYTAWRQLAMG